MGKYNDFQNDHGVVGVSGGAAGAVSSPGLDCKGMEQVTALLQTGTIIATGTINVVVEHSDDDGAGDAYSTLTGAVFAEQSTGDSDLLFLGKIKTNTAGTKRWLRITGTAAVAVAEYGALLISQNLSGHLPLTVNALGAPVFNVGNP